ncbi:hypothetical protein LEMLEM_LOCUS15767, partial [Lemmus lemmus]
GVVATCREHLSVWGAGRKRGLEVPPRQSGSQVGSEASTLGSMTKLRSGAAGGAPPPPGGRGPCPASAARVLGGQGGRGGYWGWPQSSAEPPPSCCRRPAKSSRVRCTLCRKPGDPRRLGVPRARVPELQQEPGPMLLLHFYASYPCE